MKRLIYDIETSPNIGTFWRPGYNLTITYKDIIKERAIICISYKWEDKKVQHLTWDKNQNDEKMLRKFAEISHEADETVAHNGDRFDIKWIRGRALLYGISMPPDIITIDTCKLARSLFNLNSYKLDYISQYLGVGSKIDTGGLELWHDIILRQDAKALKKMVAYCDNDVVILEKVYKKMKPYIKSKTRTSLNRTKCPECSGFMEVSKQRVLASGSRRMQLRCTQCGKYSTIPLSVFEKQR